MKSRRCGFLLLLAALLVTTNARAAPDPRQFGLVPWPQKVTTSDGTFTPPAQWTISASTPDERNVASFAIAYLRDRGTTVYEQNIAQPTLRLSMVANEGIAHEGYRLHIDEQGIDIRASSGAGLFYGLQTLEELVDTQGAALPVLDVEDAPRFPWRGIHLDVARHFFPVPVVERYIDVAAHYKLNVFHWHLTDDQGWRIEIKAEPRLTAIGGCRAQTQIGRDPTALDGRRTCGYYTQADIRDVVEYARKRYVTIVPEIDMPGHADASIAAYPSLACGAPHILVRQTWGPSRHAYCPTEATFAFIDNVIGEVTALFPGPVIHAGGDEVSTDEWRRSPEVAQLMAQRRLRTFADVQRYFETRVAAIVAKHGRRMAGWDDLLGNGVARTTTITAWHSVARGVKAAEAGYDVVLSPDGPLYFDAYQGDPRDEPLAVGGLSRLQDVYAFDPVPSGTPDVAEQHIIGVQGNLWTEYVATAPYLFYMLLPRELALSEVAWSPAGTRDWPWFQAQSAAQYAWLERRGDAFRIPNPQFGLSEAGDAQIDNVSSSLRTAALHVANSRVIVSLQVPIPGASIHYTLDGTIPTKKSTTYRGPFVVQLRHGSPRDIIATAMLADGRASTPTELLVAR